MEIVCGNLPTKMQVKNAVIKKMKNQKLILITCAVFMFIMMIGSDQSAYTTEMAIAEAKGEVFEKSFSPMWESFIIPLLVIVIAFLPNPKK